MYRMDKFITNKLIPSKPLKPSIKFDPFIINKKQSKIKIDKKYLFFKKLFKNIKSTLPILIENKLIKNKMMKAINNSLRFGLIFIFKSSKKPNKNINDPKKK